MFGGEEEQQGSDPTESRKSSHRAVLEKKLSIADRAVATNPGCIALQLERLRICQELWEPSLLAKEWKKLVSVCVLCASMWLTQCFYIWTICDVAPTSCNYSWFFLFFALIWVGKSLVLVFGSFSFTLPYDMNLHLQSSFNSSLRFNKKRHIFTFCQWPKLTVILTQTHLMLYLLHFRCSSTQTVPPCGRSICSSPRPTSATSQCQRSTLPMGSV